MDKVNFFKKLRMVYSIESYWIDKSILKMYSRDYWPLLVYKHVENIDIESPYGIVIPKTEDEVVKVLRLASEFGIPLRVYGGGSGVLGGAKAGEDEVIIDLSRLNWIRWYDKRSRIVDVGSGAYMAEVESWLNNQGYTSRHYPQSINVATIGGLISTYSSGQYSTGYGNIEDMILGIHYATPGGELIKLKPVPRGNILPILMGVVFGSEGSLGVITRVYLSVYKKPKKSIKFIYLIDSFEKAIEQAYKLIEYGVYPHLLRIFDEYESMLNFGLDRWGAVALGILEGGLASKDNMRLLDKLFGKKLQLGLFEKWYNSRNDVIRYIYTLFKSGLAVETVELSAPWSKVISIYNDIRSRVLEIEGVKTATAHIGHFYNSGVGLYFTLTIELNRLKSIYRDIWDTIEYICMKHGGAPLHHHGIGKVRGKYVREFLGINSINLLASIKRTIDPKNILRGGLEKLVQ